MKPFKFSKKRREYIKWGKNVTEVRTMPEKTQESGEAARLQMKTEGGGAQGIYANLAAITHTETEFVLDFLFMQPDRHQARVHTRVISNPVSAKRLCAALQESLKGYEDRFGAVKE